LAAFTCAVLAARAVGVAVALRFCSRPTFL
jgi:hypothetical protein